MDNYIVAIFAMVAVVLGLVLRQSRPEYTNFLSMAAGVGIAIMVMGKLRLVVDGLKQIMASIPWNQEYFLTFLKMAGIAYVTEFAADICRDNGSSTMANQLQIFGKLSILVLSLPIFLTLIGTIQELL